MVGFEAPARWPGTRRGRCHPASSSRLAEETGHITPLGAWCWRNATSDMARGCSTAAGVRHRRTSASTCPRGSGGTRGFWTRCAGPSTRRGWSRGRCSWS
ncbi:hypothetical protein ACRAWF_12010 [Streptomyces sp. L7]